MSAAVSENPFYYFNLWWSSCSVHRQCTVPLSYTPEMTHTDLFRYGNMMADTARASSPHQLIMVTIIAVISQPNCRRILRPFCLNGKVDDLHRRCPASEHHFGLDPCAPWTPPLSSPPLIPSCLHYRDVEVTLCKGRGLGVTPSLRRSKNRCHVILTTEEPLAMGQWGQWVTCCDVNFLYTAENILPNTCTCTQPPVVYWLNNHIDGST